MEFFHLCVPIDIFRWVTPSFTQKNITKIFTISLYSNQRMSGKSKNEVNKLKKILSETVVRHKWKHHRSVLKRSWVSQRTSESNA